ncbi:short chain dehydrogenase domain-containing protein [Ditylenchus destructor]|uniref:Short-chain dehydrogenase/reductase 3 n=1 Tax=Ditylenchus destructor TaxID=166010 RepID=A0AAD4MRA3_9BILA|nr:short chain dehydrogenase domain-containing protein [Ditylenchus destructor]
MTPVRTLSQNSNNHETDQVLTKFSFIKLLLFLWHFLASVARGFYRNVTPISWQKKKDLKGKLILVTGAGGGIGTPLALKLAARGAKLILWDANGVANEATAKQCRNLGAEAVAHQVDITDRNKVYELADKIKSEIGTVEIVINNAGLLNPARFLDIPDQRIEKLMDVNTRSLFWTTKAFLPQMLEERKGHLVCVCSAAGLFGARGLVDYSASKFAAFGFMEALEYELHGEGFHEIDFTTVCPTFVQTAMINNFTIQYRNISILTSDYVAERIVDAIELNQRVMMIPRILYWLYAIKGLLPWNLYEGVIFRKRTKYS